MSSIMDKMRGPTEWGGSIEGNMTIANLFEYLSGMYVFSLGKNFVSVE